MFIAKWMIAFVAIYGGLGGLIFDAVIPSTACQHIRNPKWPPHAKFHNGQTMLLGFCNAAIAIALLFALPSSLGSFLLAAALAEAYFLCMLMAPVFPGTAWSDPEFVAINPKPFGIPVQKFLSLLASAVVLIAVLIVIV
ncbi:DUF6640 family protein [Komagataeibacter xylinus]|uniref:Uncharacterized protein n=1 Tax=Komagataeibacter xylinus TaxID=28448 RepID=A0A857FUJ8_KOMXY|nr:DUF6640 family protein [Komagataeibacter xylinus]QHC37349.1 hypothetical protein FMA36_17195 [Komagataeibacter xylinus]